MKIRIEILVMIMSISSAIQLMLKVVFGFCQRSRNNEDE